MEVLHHLRFLLPCGEFPVFQVCFINLILYFSFDITEVYGGCRIKSSEKEKIDFHLWTRRPDETFQYYDLEFGNKVQLQQALNNTKRLEIFVFFHAIGSNGNAPWIMAAKDYYEDPRNTNIVMSVDYEAFVQSNTRALRNVETIATHTAEYLGWIADFWLNKTQQTKYFPNVILSFVGHEIGANIAGRTGEILQETSNYTRYPYSLAALNPFVISPEALSLQQLCNKFRFHEIQARDALLVHVYHTSTCSLSPVIPACNSNLNATMGEVDIYFNGGAIQPGCAADDSRCSNNRATDYFVVALNFTRHIPSYTPSDLVMIAKSCPSYDDFERGRCDNCSYLTCFVMQDGHPSNYKGRYMIKTNADPPYERDYVKLTP